jgi:two-component system sensor histidine kinase CpxA
LEDTLRKSGIFIKIYLWFWLATALIVAAQIGLDRLTEQNPPFAHHIRQTLETALAVYGQTALDFHVRGNHAETAKLAEAIKNSTGVSVYFVDRSSKYQDNHSLPEDVLSSARQIQEGGEAEFILSKDKALLARSLTAEDGTRFSIVGRMQSEAFGPPKPPGPPGRLGPPPGSKPIFLDAFGSPPPPGRSPLFLVARILVILLMSGGVCYLLARYFTTPVVTLREATRRFAGGNLSVRIGKGISNRKDELSELATDFDHMAERISSLMAQQRQLLRDISHELRSPLTRLNVAVELARRQAGDDTKPILDRIETEATVLNGMIGQVLTIARLDSETESIEMTPVDLKELITEITEDANFEAQARNCTVEIVESTRCTVSGNKELLRRAIENVIRNAAVYTHKNTKVAISLRNTIHDSTSYAEIAVRDHGPGVPESDLPNLFRPFYRVSNARERQTGGTGLGLAITKRAVSLHNGTITVTNAQGGGLIVEILLPLLKVIRREKSEK